MPRLAFLSIEQVRNHPRWTIARDSYLQLTMDGHGPDPTIRRLMHDIARSVLFNILSLHAVQVEARESWATVNRIREVFAPFGLASPRRFDEMIARLRQVGLIELRPAPSDKRLRLVVPTARMIEEDYAWQDHNMRPLAVLLPESQDYDAVFSHDPLYRHALRAVCAGIMVNARTILDVEANPLIAFLMRQSGGRIIFSYLIAALAGGDPLRVSLRYEDVSIHAGTSRTHVRNMILALEAAGFLQRHGRGGHDIELRPELWEQADRFIASVLSGNDCLWQLTRARVDAIRQSTQ